jgi:MarR family transcriptional regulator, transcriptional regulator for hemolysin
MALVRDDKRKLINQTSDEVLDKVSYEAIIISFTLWQTFSTYVTGFQSILRPWDINPSQCQTLWFLRYFDTPLTASRIARLLALETHSVTSLLDGLEKRKLIKRRHSKTDRRVIEIILTDSGKQILTEIRQSYLPYIYDMFKGDFSEAELKTFIRVLQGIWDTGLAWQRISPDKVHLIAEEFAGRMRIVVDDLAESRSATAAGK